MLPTIRRRVFDAPFDLIDREFGRMARRLFSEDAPSTSATAAYPVDVREDQDHLYVDAEMPGFTKDQIDVTLENNVLSIVAERKMEAPTEESGTTHLRERVYSRLARSFTVPNTVDENKVDAHLENGVLHLTLHKREEVKPRRIEVK